MVDTTDPLAILAEVKRLINIQANGRLQTDQGAQLAWYLRLLKEHLETVALRQP